MTGGVVGRPPPPPATGDQAFGLGRRQGTRKSGVSATYRAGGQSSALRAGVLKVRDPDAAETPRLATSVRPDGRGEEEEREREEEEEEEEEENEQEQEEDTTR